LTNGCITERLGKFNVIYDYISSCQIRMPLNIVRGNSKVGNQQRHRMLPGIMQKLSSSKIHLSGLLRGIWTPSNTSVSIQPFLQPL